MKVNPLIAAIVVGGDDFRPAQGVVYTQTAKGWVLKLAPERQFTTKGERGKECGH